MCGLQMLDEHTTLVSSRSSLAGPDVNHSACKHDKRDSISHLVVWLTTDHGPMRQARITNHQVQLRQQQQPDGHASAWTEKPSEAGSELLRKATSRNGYVTDTTKGLSKKVHCSPVSSIHILYNHAPSGGVGPPPGGCTGFAIFNCPEVVRPKAHAVPYCLL